MCCGVESSRALMLPPSSLVIGGWDWELHDDLNIRFDARNSRERTKMQSGYTCQRCLKSLGKTFKSNKNAPASRWKSSSSRVTGRFSKSEHPLLQSNIGPRPCLPIYTRDGFSSIRRQSNAAAAPSERPLLQPNNLFHLFSESPSPEIRKRAMFMKTHAYCPHPSHHQTRLPTSPHDLEARKSKETSSVPPTHVRFECPDCGIPVSCSEEHWADDYETHMELCDTLREANEDDHDLRSGRYFPEFEYPGPQIEEILVNLTNWDTYLYTRNFNAINDPRSMRQATRLLTFPVTVASVLNELSPYNIRQGGRLTMEGLKSLSGM